METLAYVYCFSGFLLRMRPSDISIVSQTIILQEVCNQKTSQNGSHQMIPRPNDPSNAIHINRIDYTLTLSITVSSLVTIFSA